MFRPNGHQTQQLCDNIKHNVDEYDNVQRDEKRWHERRWLYIRMIFTRQKDEKDTYKLRQDIFPSVATSVYSDPPGLRTNLEHEWRALNPHVSADNLLELQWCHSCRACTLVLQASRRQYLHPKNSVHSAGALGYYRP